MFLSNICIHIECNSVVLLPFIFIYYIVVIIKWPLCCKAVNNKIYLLYEYYRRCLEVKGEQSI